MVSRWAFRLVVAAIIGLSVWMVLEEQVDILQPTTDDNDAADTPDFFAERFILDVTDETGSLTYQLHGEALDHFAGEDVWLIEAPWLIVQTESGAPWELRAPIGRAWNAGTEASLDGAVNIRRPATTVNTEATIETRDVYIQPQAFYAETEAPTVFIDASSVMRGVGSRAYLDRNIVQLLSETRGTYEPATEP